MKLLVAVDIQNDFITGPLGTPEARAALPRMVAKIKGHHGWLRLTKDTHASDYPDTQEGRLLPVAHCVKGTPGWEFPDAFKDALRDWEEGNPGLGILQIVEKGSFGSMALVENVKALHDLTGKVDSIELIGLCTDVCVISNALLLKAFLPEMPISVDAACCAGVTPAKHAAALETMESCQIIIANCRRA